MAITHSEIEERWLGGITLDEGADALVDSFSRIERMLGRAWLETPLRHGVRGPAVVLPLHATGQQLRVLERSVGADELLKRLVAGQPAARSELHALSLCAGDSSDVEVEIEPTIEVGLGERRPDFAVRRPGEGWTYVEVTAPVDAEDTLEAKASAQKLVAALPRLPVSLAVEVRFREPASDELVARVEAELSTISSPGTFDRSEYVVQVSEATAVFQLSTGADEKDRPMCGCMTSRIEGEVRTSLSIRIPYSDERAQRILDAEAKQLPKAGPGLVCIETHNRKVWRALIERSFSPTIRRRISGALLFESGIVLGSTGLELQTAGRLLPNPHARATLPGWLTVRLSDLPHQLGGR